MLRYVGSRKIPTWKTLTRKILTHQTQNILRGPVSHLTLSFINNKLQFFNTTYNYRLSFTVNKSVFFSFFNFLTWHEVITYIGETPLRVKLIKDVIYLITWLYPQKVSGRSESIVDWYYSENFLAHGFSITPFYFFFCLWLLDFDSKQY